MKVGGPFRAHESIGLLGPQYMGTMGEPTVLSRKYTPLTTWQQGTSGEPATTELSFSEVGKFKFKFLPRLEDAIRAALEKTLRKVAV